MNIEELEEEGVSGAGAQILRRECSRLEMMRLAFEIPP